MRGDRLFRREFRPVANPGEYVVLRGDGQNDLIVEGGNSPIWQVSHVESPGDGLGLKAASVIWCGTDTPGAPYLADANAVAGTNLGAAISAGGISQALQPKWATLQRRQFAQVRFLFHPIKDSNGIALAGAAQDYDILINAPAASQRFGNAFLRGVINMANQFSLPGDIEPLPAQGSNITVPSNFQVDPFEQAYKSELFLFGVDDQQLSITIRNNGSGSASTGGIAAQYGVFLHNLVPVPLPEPHECREVLILGRRYSIPAGINLDNVVLVPVGAQSTPSQS